MKLRRLFAPFMLACYSIMAREAGAQDLRKAFIHPPDSARPQVWWHWLNGNVSKAGITADLEAMRQVGIGGGTIASIPFDVEGPAPFMSDAWRGMVTHATSEAKRLGMELGFFNCEGWSSSGGPWITPDIAMQRVVWSEKRVTGGTPVTMTLPQPLTRLNYYRDIATLAFPTPSREMLPGFADRAPAVTGTELDPLPANDGAASVLPAAQIVDLTDKVDAEGKLTWAAPAGDWTVLRFGYTPIGVTNHPATKYGIGLECDKLSKEALKKHFAGFVDKVIADAGPLAGKTLVYSLIDSYETGEQNWTAAFPREFQQRRGYNPRSWLPALTGRTVGSLDVTERFREDFRRTITDLWTENYYGYFAQLLHERGMKSEVEAYGNGSFDDLRSSGLNDMPMSEFWFGNHDDGGLAKMASSAAHTYGRPIVGAESFTSGNEYNFDPASMKIEGDRMFAQGVNRYYFHSYAQQAQVDGSKPGLIWSNGINLTRNLTWWNQGKDWFRYIARCQMMLQQGSFVADILSYQGEDTVHFEGDGRPLREPPAGYDFDGLTTELLMAASVKDGQIVLPGGMRYRVLALPNALAMSPEILHHVRYLVRAGAIVFGPRPIRAFGLSGAPRSDAEVKRLADELWGSIDGKQTIVNRLGSGRVYWTGSMTALQPVFDDLKIVPDCAYQAQDAEIKFLHRRVGSTEVYFLTNQEAERVEATCAFRVTGKLPELWDAEKGTMRPAPVWRSESDGRTTLPISFEPGQSVFVVFEKPAPASDHLVAVDFVDANSVAATKHTLEIRHAVYGAVEGGGGTADLTATLAGMVKEGALRAHAGNALAGSDPAVLHVKQLRIEYTYDGQPGEMTVPEGGIIKIPVPKSRVPNPAYELAGSPAGSTWLRPWKPGKYTLAYASGKQVERDIKTLPAVLEITGPWTVHFDPRWGGPSSVAFDRLDDWTRRPEEGIQHYSGTAEYAVAFDIPHAKAKNEQMWLDLGDLKNLAEVTLNGHNLGVLWKAPWRVDVTHAIQPGRNNLEVKVTNLWANRLIGDTMLPADRKVAHAMVNPYRSDSPLQLSGLLGPVTLQFAPLLSTR